MFCSISSRPTPNSYARIVFVDYSSAFNTVVPEKLFHKLQSLSVELSLCYRILDFLLHRPQVAKIWDAMPDTGHCAVYGQPGLLFLASALDNYSLYTNDCVLHHDSTKVVKVVDDTIVEGLVRNADESTYIGRRSGVWRHGTATTSQP